MKNKMYFFDYVNIVLMLLVIVVTLYPFLNVAAVSFTTYEEYLMKPMMVWPDEWTTTAYRTLIGKPSLWTSYANTIFITAVTTILSILLYLVTAYPLSRKNLRGKSGIMTYMVFTMMFSGGLIPTFYVVKMLGLYNSLWAIVLTALFSTYNVTLVKNFMESIPDSLIEAARIDGASEFYILFKIIAPLSKAIVATVAMFVAVGQWNSYATSIYYLKDTSKWTLALFLREIILGSSITDVISGSGKDMMQETVNPITIQYAALIITVLPILAVYPFVQKYFVKGMMVGSVKE
ncbi:MAG: carbohydrate ABC transporter permease [Clostridia bacterium]|nr:carbohydrate ABC transporter permease [Clostridia bacterium]